MSREIWCIFTIDNDYDQPEDNLENFWFEKPTLQTFAKQIGVDLETANEDKILRVIAAYKGEDTQITDSDTSYRLQTKEGLTNE